MWLFALGFFLITGPGEAFLANMGSLIHSVNAQSDTRSGVSAEQFESNPAVHVSIIAVTSTFARIASGLISDYYAPPVPTTPPPSDDGSEPDDKEPFHISRVSLIIFFALFMPIAHICLASGLIQEYPYLFWIVSSSIGIAYGAVFSLAPNITISIWGHNNFSTFWGEFCLRPK